MVLTFEDEDGIEYRLCRYNGKHPSQHTNKFERANGLPNSSFRNKFHIHMATQRYQEEGFDIDGYAEVAKDYASFESALSAFVRSNGFTAPNDSQELLF